MDWFWIKLLIGAVVGAAWIAGNIKEKLKAPGPAAPPPLPPADPDAPAPAATADDLQEFLKQIRRRMGEPEPQKTEEPLPAVLVEEAPRIEPPPVVPAPKKKPRFEAPKPPRRKAEPTVLLPEALKSFPTSTSEPAPMANRAKPPSAAVRDAVRLLKSPSGLKTAFILREILSEPLAKRRRSK